MQPGDQTNILCLRGCHDNQHFRFIGRKAALALSLTMAALLLPACADRDDADKDIVEIQVQPDWVRAGDAPPVPAQVGMSPSERIGHPFDPLPEGIQWRLWRYSIPSIKQVSLPREYPMDIAVVAIDARITAIEHQALCKTDSCDPVKPQFQAIALLVGRPGSFKDAGLEIGSRIEYGQPSKHTPAEVSALD